MSKPKKDVEWLTQEINVGPKITNHFHITLHNYLKQKTKSCTYMEVVCLILGPSLSSWVSTTLTLFASFLGFWLPYISFIFIENVFYVLYTVSMTPERPISRTNWMNWRIEKKQITSTTRLANEIIFLCIMNMNYCWYPSNYNVCPKTTHLYWRIDLIV